MSEHELPEGCALRKLSDLVGPGGLISDGDWIETKDQDPTGEVRLVQLADIGDGHYRNRSSRFLTASKARELSCTFLKTGDLLIARMPEPLGRCCIFPGDPKRAVTAVDVCIVRPSPGGVDVKWLMHALNSRDVRVEIEALAKGTTRQRISRRNLESLELPVPPVPEQKRIVAQVDALLEIVNAVRERLARASAILKRFRQAVLAAVCEGRLTGSEKAGWVETTLGEVFSVQTGATPLRKRTDYYKGGTIPWIKTGQVQGDKIESADEFITPLAVQETNAKVFPVGTILVAMYGEGRTRGQIGVLGIPASTNQACAALVSSDLPSATRAYVYWYLRGQYEAMREVSVGGNQPNLSLGIIKRWPLSLPPLREQGRIVRRVEALFMLADAINKRVAVAIARVEKLTQAILGKAFRGELVPTEAELARREGRGYKPALRVSDRVQGRSTRSSRAGGSPAVRGKTK